MDGNVPLPPPPTTHIDGDRLLLNAPFSPSAEDTPAAGGVSGGRAMALPHPFHLNELLERGLTGTILYVFFSFL